MVPGIDCNSASPAGKTTAFQQYEAQLYEELVNLIGESSILHDSLISALKLEIETYQRALDPIASTTARLEDLSTTSGSPQGSVAPSSALGGPVSSVGGPAAGQAPQTGVLPPSCSIPPSRQLVPSVPCVGQSSADPLTEPCLHEKGRYISVPAPSPWCQLEAVGRVAGRMGAADALGAL